MGVEATPVVEEKVVAWIQALLGQARALEDPKDPDWRHAYGLAQGAGFVLRSRAWPPFPTTSGSSFQALVSEEQVRRKRGEGPRPAGANDPLAAKPDADDEDAPSLDLKSQEAQAESLIKGVTKQVQEFGPADASWRYAFGLAQGMGVLLRSARWPANPLAPGSQLGRLLADEQATRPAGAAPAAAPPAPPAPPSASTPRPPQPPRPPVAPAAPGRQAPTPQPPTTRPQPPRALVPTPPAGVPRPPAPPAPKPAERPPEKGTGEAFRAMPTLVSDEESNDGAPPKKAPAAEGDAFRAMPTLNQEGDEEEAAPAKATLIQGDEEEAQDDAHRAKATLLQGDADEPLPPPPPPQRPLPTPSSGAHRTLAQVSSGRHQALPPPPQPAPAAQTLASGPRPGEGSGERGTGRVPTRPSMRDAMAGRQTGKVERASASEGEHVDRIGKYQVVSRLGKGAMGQVFKGRGPDGALVALKVLHQHLGQSKRVRARFLREAKAIERIQHPNVVRFVEAGDEQGVGQFIAMEFVDGKPLHDALRDRGGQRFDLKQASDLILQTCRGLRAAHAAGVVHRDLKPENILLSSKNEIKITDFSLARREQDSMLLTRQGQVMGTPHFMSPEQAKGQAIDVRTDVYSLGALMYVLLTGQFPFPNGTVAEVIASHCEKPRPDPRAIATECPAEVANVYFKCMAIDRAERFPSVDAVIEELHRVLGLPPEEEEVELPEGSLAPGARIDEYTIEKVLGAGGMGAVYVAKSGAGDKVALKVLPPQAGRDPQERVKDVRRFLNEAKLAKKCISPNIYKILKYGVDEGGQAFMAATLADGTSLREYVAKHGPLNPTQVMKVGRGIVQALQMIHGADVIHRDITPANVILRGDWQTAKDANACIIDFGLAIPIEREKPRGQEGATALFKHRVSTAKQDDDSIDMEALYVDDLPGGTPAYMAPEVLEDPSGVDERADLYGLGATLYYAATGHAPYTADGIEAVLYQQKTQPPAPVSQFNADFPEELWEFMFALLAHQPGARPRSAKLVLSKLQRLEDPRALSNPATASTPAPVIVAAPPASRGPAFAVGFLVGALVGAGACWAALQAMAGKL